MSKMIFIAAAMGVCSAGAAVTYYVSPAAQTDISVPVMLVDKSAASVMTELAGMTAEKFLLQISGKREAKNDLSFFKPSTLKISENVVRFTSQFHGEHWLQIDAIVTPAGDGKSQIDIQVKIPDNKFRRHPALHPYDIKASESMIDFIVTDYVESVLKRKRMAIGNELNDKQVDALLGFSQEQGEAFKRRIKLAFEECYGTELEELEHELRDRERGSNSSMSAADYATEAAAASAAPAAEQANDVVASAANSAAAESAESAASGKFNEGDDW